MCRLSRRLTASLVGLLVLTWGPVATSVAGHTVEADPVGVWPLQPTPAVVSLFDPPSDPWGAGHRGVDLLGSPGQPVRAALAGQVTYAGRLAGRGVVVVGHGETRTTYEPVDAAVAVGDEVTAGAVLGRVETLGSHCFPRSCLHWGWLRGSIYLDPLLLVGGGPVRLLPLWRDEPVTATGALATTPTTGRPWARWRPWGARASAIRLAGGLVGRPVAGGPW